MTSIVYVRRIVCSNYREPVWPFADRVWRWDAAREDTSASLRPLRQQLRQSDQIERGAREDEQPVDLRQAPEFHFADPGDRLQPAECRFDARTDMLTLRVARMARRARVARTAARSAQMRGRGARSSHPAVQVNNLPHVIRLIGPHRATATRGPLPLRVQHQQP